MAVAEAVQPFTSVVVTEYWVVVVGPAVTTWLLPKLLLLQVYASGLVLV